MGIGACDPGIPPPPIPNPPNPQSPNTNPQSPIPNPQIIKKYKFNINKLFIPIKYKYLTH